MINGIKNDPQLAVQNTDHEIYTSAIGDYYADRIFTTATGGIGFSVGGHAIVKPLRDWWELGIVAGWEGDEPRLAMALRIIAENGYAVVKEDKSG